MRETSPIQAEPPLERPAAIRVLVVDDDPTACELMQEILASADMQCVAMTDSRKAAALLTHERFDSVFLDERMPGLDGIGLAHQIRAGGVNRSTPIVMITGEDDRSLLARAFKEGVNFFLFKPVDRYRIMRLIRVTEGSIQHEARRFQRVRIHCKVWIEFKGGQLSGSTLDLSLGGMFVQASGSLPTGSNVTVKLELKPGQPPIRLGGHVTRVTGEDCMGLQIDSAGSKDYKAFQEFLLPLILRETHSGMPAKST
jgi:CheY-like chemotaxis protein